MDAGDSRLTYDALLAHCLAKPGAWRDEPWEGDIVTKVGERIFAFLGRDPAAPTDPTGSEDADSAAVGLGVGVKAGATRQEADEWLHQYPDDASVMAYIGRSGWNSLRVGGAIPDEEILEAIDASYDAVVAKLPKSRRPKAD